MFAITAGQLAALDRVAAARLHERIATFLRVEMAGETERLSDRELIEFIGQAHSKAAAHGIESDAAVAQYVCLALEAGTGFADVPGIAQWLHEPDTDPEEQLEYLVDLLADTAELEALLPAATAEGDEPMAAELRAELDARNAEEL